MTTQRNILGLALVLALSGHAFVGCGDDSNESPSEDDGGVAGKGGKGGSAGKGGAGGKAGASAAGKGGAGGKAGVGGKGGAGGKAGSGDEDGGTGNCEGEKGCYSCEPKSYDQHLNACTDAVCNVYDNSKLKKLGSDGKLPAIP
jgi:hypothetical protein